mmetsp:Transcript_779/g.1293  ORF Transcript_779/g.1293 Transcript_779/m.1293 type:complete len:362 (-) Transcript_779:95-1180(-)
MHSFVSLTLLIIAAPCYCEDPISFHDLFVVEPSGNAVMRLRGYDRDGDSLKYRVTSVPKSGSLHQLSKVYSAYGYDPKDGTRITNTPVLVTGSKNRVYYKRSTPDIATNNKWGTFSYTVSDARATSYNATVTLVPPSGAIVGSNFLLNNEGWRVVGNREAYTSAQYEPYSRGLLLNHYIIGTDDKINVDSSDSQDMSLWYFDAPESYLGNMGIAYGGSFEFTVAAFSGDFSQLNDDAHLVVLDCEDCVGPVGSGITLAYPLSTALAKQSFSGDAVTFTLSLHEKSGWVKDPQNSLKRWTTPSQCDLIQVLSRLSSVRILGDFTRWYESVAIDNVLFYNKKGGQIPVCAMHRPDASICTCSN